MNMVTRRPINTCLGLILRRTSILALSAVVFRVLDRHSLAKVGMIWSFSVKARGQAQSHLGAVCVSGRVGV